MGCGQQSEPAVEKGSGAAKAPVARAGLAVLEKAVVVDKNGTELFIILLAPAFGPINKGSAIDTAVRSMAAHAAGFAPVGKAVVTYSQAETVVKTYTEVL